MGNKRDKTRFVNVGNQEWQEWIESIVAKAAKYNLLVDIHDAYRPNGFSRTYPNLLTQEGIHGNEQVPDADHNTMLPFTRFTIGAGDYTPGYTRKDLQTTFAHRLALPVIYYSPAQFLFWNEKLTGEHKRPELDFLGEYSHGVARYKVLAWGNRRVCCCRTRFGNNLVCGRNNQYQRTLFAIRLFVSFF